MPWTVSARVSNRLRARLEVTNKQTNMIVLNFHLGRAALMSIVFLWAATPSSLVHGHRRFGGSCSLRLCQHKGVI